MKESTGIFDKLNHENGLWENVLDLHNLKPGDILRASVGPIRPTLRFRGWILEKGSPRVDAEVLPQEEWSKVGLTSRRLP